MSLEFFQAYISETFFISFRDNSLNLHMYEKKMSSLNVDFRYCEMSHYPFQNYILRFWSHDRLTLPLYSFNKNRVILWSCCPLHFALEKKHDNL